MQAPDAKKILEAARFNKATIYDYQLSYDMPDGRTISVVRSSQLFSKKDIEEMLVEAVQEAYAELN